MAGFVVEGSNKTFFVAVQGVVVSGPHCRLLALDKRDELERKTSWRERPCLCCRAVFLSEGVMSYGATRLMVGLLRVPMALISILNPLKWVRAGLVALRIAILSTGIGAIVLGLAVAGVWIYKNWSGLSRMFKGFGAAFMKALGPAGPILQIVMTRIQELIGWVKSLLGPLDVSAEQWQRWGKMAGEVVGNAINSIMDAFRGLPAFLSGVWQRVSGAMSSAWAGTVEYFSDLWTRIKAGVSTGWELIKSLFFDYTPLGLVITHWDSITEYFADLWKAVKVGVALGWELIKKLLLDYTPAGIIYTHWDGLVEWFGILWTRVKARFVLAWANIKTEVATWPASMFTYGAELIDQMIAGIVSRIPLLNNAMVGIRNSVDPSGIAPGFTDPASGPLSYEEDPIRNPERARSLNELYEPKPRVQGRASGGSFSPGWLLTGEQGPELKYQSRSGYIAHNGALNGMLKMANRAREVVQGIGFDDFGIGMSPVPAMATVAAAGGAAMQRGPITFSPQYNMPLSFAAGVDIEEVRATVRDELMDAEERAMATVRGVLYN